MPVASDGGAAGGSSFSDSTRSEISWSEASIGTSGGQKGAMSYSTTCSIGNIVVGCIGGVGDCGGCSCRIGVDSCGGTIVGGAGGGAGGADPVVVGAGIGSSIVLVVVLIGIVGARPPVGANGGPWSTVGGSGNRS